MLSNHALLGPSGAKMWLACPPSARLGEELPDPGSRYTAAGTLAHSLGELKLRRYFEGMNTRIYNSRLKKLKAEPEYTPAMDEATDIYLEHVKARAMSFRASFFAAVETRVELTDYVPEGFGTADCLMIGESRLEIIDYKNGHLPVEAKNNPQLMLYALGALQTFAVVFGDGIETAHLSIVQPNAGGVKEWETTAAALRAWGESYVKPRARLAWEGKGEFCPDEDETCRFCRARYQCRARAAKLLALEREVREPALLSDEELGSILSRAERLSSWASALRDYTLSAVLRGRAVPGWKAVEGRRSREWTDLDKSFAALEARGIERALLWEQKPVSVSGLENALGSREFAAAADGLWTRKPGKPALAPESDPRPPYNPAGLAFRPSEAKDH